MERPEALKVFVSEDPANFPQRCFGTGENNH